MPATSAETDAAYLANFDTMWNRQLLDYPTVARNGAIDWEYFHVTPDHAQVIWEDGVRRTLDDRLDADVQWEQGEALALESLQVAAQWREADSCAMDLILDRASEIAKDRAHPAHWVAIGFLREIIVAAIEGRDAATKFTDRMWRIRERARAAR
jgi:hypothetical protein